MKYEIQKLDKRFSYHNLFKYVIKFSNTMARDNGPLHFNTTLEWFYRTYGWSAEIRQLANMRTWVLGWNTVNRFKAPTGAELPAACNPHWSWTNGYEDLRIYIASDKELAYFKLAHPCSK